MLKNLLNKIATILNLYYICITNFLLNLKNAMIMKKLMTLAMVAIASVMMVSCCGLCDKKAEAEVVAQPAAVECTQDCANCPNAATCPNAKPAAACPAAQPEAAK